MRPQGALGNCLFHACRPAKAVIRRFRSGSAVKEPWSHGQVIENEVEIVDFWYGSCPKNDQILTPRRRSGQRGVSHISEVGSCPMPNVRLYHTIMLYNTCFYNTSITTAVSYIQTSESVRPYTNSPSAGHQTGIWRNTRSSSPGAISISLSENPKVDATTSLISFFLISLRTGMWEGLSGEN